MSFIASPLLGRMNVFQRLMYQWSELYPYNAVHVYRIAGALDRRGLLASIARVYRDNGLGAVEVAADGQSYQYEREEFPELEILDGGDDPQQQMLAHVAAEINRPFSRPRCQPMRFSAVSDGPKTFYLVLAYDHWTADSVAARLVVQQVLRSYFGLGERGESRPLQLYPGTYRKVFAQRLGPVRLAAAATRLLGDAIRNRRARQVAYSAATQMAVNFEQFATAPGTVGRLREFAARAGATVNDVIQAALARALSPVLPRRAKGRGSQDLAIGNIVNVRGDAAGDLSHALGAFLSYYSVRCCPDENGDLAALARQVAHTTGPIKARHGYLDAVVNMQLASRLWPHFSTAAKPRFMKRAIPLTAGVSNVYIRDVLLDRELDRRILGYFRAASTGPILPLVITPTTVNGQMSVGITYRQTGFPRAKIDRVMEAFLTEIQYPGESPRRSSGVDRAPLAQPALSDAPVPAEAA